MKIGVLSDCRMPTKSSGGHGLGRLVVNLATVLRKRGHDVTLYAGPNSMWDASDVVIHEDETERAKTLSLDLDTYYIDCSHRHELAQHNPDYRIVNWILDGECRWHPSHALVSTPYGQKYYRSASLMTVGIDVDAIPFFKSPKGAYLAFSAKIHPHKGYKDALIVHKAQDLPVKFVGERYAKEWLPDWRDTLTGKDFYEFVGNSVGLLHPVNFKRQLGGGCMPLEAAAMGVPTIAYDSMSPQWHISHGVSGWIVADVEEMVDAVQDLPLIDRKTCREWVAETHSLDVMADCMEGYLQTEFSKAGV